MPAGLGPRPRRCAGAVAAGNYFPPSILFGLAGAQKHDAITHLMIGAVLSPQPGNPWLYVSFIL
ncbi:MAG: hypothetical protein J2P49_08390 [Methylocapsa sp.]|nr:hypothetical protein [Methylocapsa sp.]